MKPKITGSGPWQCSTLSPAADCLLGLLGYLKNNDKTGNDAQGQKKTTSGFKNHKNNIAFTVTDLKSREILLLHFKISTMLLLASKICKM